MFESKKAVEALKIAEKLQRDLTAAKIIYSHNGEVYMTTEDVLSSGIRKHHVKQIDTIERKLDALIELLGVKEVSCETIEPKLVKGKKEVSLAVKKRRYRRI